MFETEILDSSMNKFWDLETLCIREHESSVLGHTLKSWPGPRPEAWEKVDHGPFEKADSIPKFLV